MIDRLIADFDRASAGKPDYVSRMVELAGAVAAKGHKAHARMLCERALGLAKGDPNVALEARRVLSGLVPRYHVPMINDPVRIASWEQTLARVVRPGARVLDVGAGSGLLSMIAARCGAAHVTACERDPVMAEIARRVTAMNGYADRVAVVAKRSQDLEVGVDLDRPADLLLSETIPFDFSTRSSDVFDDASRRLLVPGSRIVPEGATLLLRLASWGEYPIYSEARRSAGFDMSALAPFLPDAIVMPRESAAMTLMSREHEALRFETRLASPSPLDRANVNIAASRDGTVNGIMHRVRLDLETESGITFFKLSIFHPLVEPMAVREGQVVIVHCRRRPDALTVWAE